MTEQEKREKVIKGLQESAAYFRSSFDAMYGTVACEMFRNWTDAIEQAIATLKEQEKATIEPKRIDIEEETKAWLDKMDAVDALGNIADICIDWDGYRTADGLGGLVNEIWAYARYCADRLAKAQEPVKPYAEYSEHMGTKWLVCGACKQPMIKITPNAVYPNYCPECGRKVWWE